MGKFQPRRQAQILVDMLARVIARTGLSDVTDTSVVKHILAAAARNDEEQYFQMSQLLLIFSIDTATGTDLDERAKEIQPGLITRLAAAKAAGQVVFSRSGTVGTTVIPAGARVKTEDGVVFSTTATTAITAASPEIIPGHGVGRDSDLVSAIADVAGSDGNVSAGTITGFVAKPTGVDAVTNPSRFILGEDRETDDAFRARLKNYIASLPRSTVTALESGVLGATDSETGAIVRYSKAIEDVINRGNVTLYIDDGTGDAETNETVTGEVVTRNLDGPPPGSAVGGETELYTEFRPVKDDGAFTLTSSLWGVLVRNTDYTLNPASGKIVFAAGLTAAEVITADYTRYTGLVAEAQKIVDGDADDRENYPGLRAAGILVIVDVPTVIQQVVEVTVTVLNGYDHLEVKSNVKTAINDYVNSRGISDDVVLSELTRRMKSVAGVYDVDYITPTENVIILDDELARTQLTNITVN